MVTRKKAETPEEESATAIFEPEPGDASGNGSEPNADLYDGPEAETRPTERVDESAAERAPVKRQGPRESAAEVLETAWAGIGEALEMSGTDIPVGRVLQMQAPVVGQKLDAMLADTMLDRLAQPAIQAANKGQGVGALMLFPLLIGAYERSPELGPVVYPILRKVIRLNIIQLAPALKKRAAEERRAAAAIADLATELDLPADMDPIDAIIQAIFAGAPGWNTPNDAADVGDHEPAEPTA